MTAGLPRLLRHTEVLALLGVSRPTLWEWRRSGRFPEPLKLGPRRIAWLESDVKRYIEKRDRERH